MSAPHLGRRSQPIGDCDDDCRADYSVYRPSNGQCSSNTSSPAIADQFSTWGTTGGILVATDYDYDGRIDTAVYRLSEGKPGT